MDDGPSSSSVFQYSQKLRNKTRKLPQQRTDVEDSDDSVATTRSVPSPSSKRRKKTQQIPVNIAIPTSNEYEMLSDIENKESHQMKPPRQRAAPNNSQSAKTNIIEISGVSNEYIQRVIKELNLKEKATFKKRGQKFQIFPGCIEDKMSLLALLKEKNHSFHTFTEKNDRRLSFLMLDHFNIEPRQLCEKLQAQQCKAVHCSYLVNHPENPIYIVHFDKGTTSFDALQQEHKDVEGLIIKWQKFDPSRRRPTQCKRCQVWGHSATNCNHNFRCVKCAADHNPGECERPAKSSDDKVFCVNCQKSGHPANSPSCEVYITFAEKLRKNQNRSYDRHQSRPPMQSSINARTSVNNQNKQQVKHLSLDSDQFPPLRGQLPNNFVNGTRSSYSFTPNPQNQDSPSRKDIFGQLRDLGQELNNLEFLEETISMTKKFIHDFRSCQSQQERNFILLSFTSDLSRP